MNDLDRIKELLDIAKKNDIFNMTTYDFKDFENKTIDAIEQYNMTDFEKHKHSLENSNIKYVEVKGDFEKELDDNLYVATYGSMDDGIVIVYEFNNDGKLNDIYVADACNTLEQFVSCVAEFHQDWS